MQDPREDLILNFDKYKIGLNDTFAFKCRECGNCCKNREDILLTGRDLFSIAKTLNMPIPQAIDTYCDVYIGPSSRVPVIRLLPKGKNLNCPLLVNGKCLVHTAKPTVCALFPLGRVSTGEVVEEGIKSNGKIQLHYILNPSDCGGRRKKQTVRQWLEMFRIPVEDEFYGLWTHVTMYLSEMLRSFEERKASEKALTALWNGVIEALYADYDTSQDFLPQFKVNSEKIMSIVKELNSVFSDVKQLGGFYSEGET